MIEIEHSLAEASGTITYLTAMLEAAGLQPYGIDKARKPRYEGGAPEVNYTFIHGNITVTTFFNAPPSVETSGPGDDEHGGWPMDGEDLVKAANIYRLALAVWNGA
jgi:hypothetical protein